MYQVQPFGFEVLVSCMCNVKYINTISYNIQAVSQTHTEAKPSNIEDRTFIYVQAKVILRSLCTYVYILHMNIELGTLEIF